MLFITDSHISDIPRYFHGSNVVVPVINKSLLDRTKIRLISIYVYNIKSKSEYMINLRHNDLPKITKPINFQFKDSICYDRVLTKLLGEVYDAQLYYWWKTGHEFEFQYNKGIQFYQKQFRKVQFEYIPITLIIEQCRTIKDLLLGVIHMNFNSTDFKRYHDDVFLKFKQIEQPGARINQLHDKAFKFPAGRMISNYRMTTTTGRPSNTFNGFNMAALNKEDDTRELIIPDDNSKLIEFDYSAFHIRLISKLIGYQLPNGNLHEYFGRQYFRTPILTSEEYDEAKSMSFRVMYGMNTDLYNSIPFFNKLHEYRKKLYDEYRLNGFIQSVIYHRPIGMNENLPENKIFNYLLQSYETEFNSIVISKILDYLLNKESKLILYTYDSFLFNIKNDERECIEELKKIIYVDNFTGSIKSGDNYRQMEIYH